MTRFEYIEKQSTVQQDILSHEDTSYFLDFLRYNQQRVLNLPAYARLQAVRNKTKLKTTCKKSQQSPAISEHT